MRLWQKQALQSSGKWTCPKEPRYWGRKGSSFLASFPESQGRKVGAGVLHTEKQRPRKEGLPHCTCVAELWAAGAPVPAPDSMPPCPIPAGQFSWVPLPDAGPPICWNSLIPHFPWEVFPEPLDRDGSPLRVTMLVLHRSTQRELCERGSYSWLFLQGLAQSRCFTNCWLEKEWAHLSFSLLICKTEVIKKTTSLTLF